MWGEGEEVCVCGRRGGGLWIISLFNPCERVNCVLLPIYKGAAL